MEGRTEEKELILDEKDREIFQSLLERMMDEGKRHGYLYTASFVEFIEDIADKKIIPTIYKYRITINKEIEYGE